MSETLPIEAWYEADREPETDPAFRTLVLLDEPNDTEVWVRVDRTKGTYVVNTYRDATRHGIAAPQVAFEEHQVVKRVKRPWHAYRRGQVAQND